VHTGSKQPKHLENRYEKRNVDWRSCFGFRFSWRKMEVAAQDLAVCSLYFTGNDKE